MEAFYVTRKQHIQVYRLSKLNQDLSGLDLSNKWKKKAHKGSSQNIYRQILITYMNHK